MIYEKVCVKDSIERENMIREQIKQGMKHQKVFAQADEDLNEVLNLAEYPTALLAILILNTRDTIADAEHNTRRGMVEKVRALKQFWGY